MDPADRRIAARHRVTFGAACDTGDGMRSGRVLDLSLTGAFVHADEMLPLGTDFVLFPLDDAADELFEIRARVVRHVTFADLTQAPGMGVEFLDVGPRERKAIAKLMKRMPVTSSRSLTHMPVVRDADMRLEDDERNRAWTRIGIRMFTSRRAG